MIDNLSIKNFFQRSRSIISKLSPTRKQISLKSKNGSRANRVVKNVNAAERMNIFSTSASSQTVQITQIKSSYTADLVWRMDNINTSLFSKSTK